MNINLHIERLVLDGTRLDPRDGRLLRAAVEAELRRLLGDGSSPGARPAGGALARVTAPAIRYQAADDARAWGTSIARSVHAAVKP